MNVKVGIINKNNTKPKLISFLENSGLEYFLSEDPIEVIKNSDIVFYFQKQSLLPNGLFDNKTLNETIEEWGYCFENEISVTNKIFAICTPTNVGETQRISEILNPMNIDVVYLPITFKFDKSKIIVGTLNQRVQTILSTLFQSMFDNKYGIITLSSESAEILHNIENLKNYYKQVFNLMIDEIFHTIKNVDDINLIKHYTTFPYTPITRDNDFELQSFQVYLNSKNIQIDLTKDVFDNLSGHLDSILDMVEKSNDDKSVPLIVDGITYLEPENEINPNKLILSLKLVELGYSVIILENESFLKNKKIIMELQNDFGEKITFYKKGTKPQGKLLPI